MQRLERLFFCICIWFLYFIFVFMFLTFHLEITLQEDDSEQILTFSEIPNEEYPLYPAG